MINEFRGKYYFLSNFYSSPVTYEGLTYLNNEAAFQSAKTFSDRECFMNLDPSSAKKLAEEFSFDLIGKRRSTTLCTKL